MATKVKDVHSCVQCEGDKMLEVRKHASEAFEIMDRLSNAYTRRASPPPTIVQFVEALIDAERDQRRLQCTLRSDAERRVKAVAELIAALRFISDATKETYSSGVNLSSKAMTIPLTELLRVAIYRLKSLVDCDQGLLDGRQPQNEKDFLAGLVERAKGT